MLVVLSLGFLGVGDSTRSDPVRVFGRDGAEEYARLKDEGCPRRTANPFGSGVSASIKVGGNSTTLPDRSFLGTSNGVADMLGLVMPDRQAMGFNVSGSMKVDTTGDIPPVSLFGANGNTSTYVKLGAFYNNASLQQHGITADPGAGNRLLIPGPEGGASGFSLGGYPLNMVTDGTYSMNLFKTGGHVGVGQSTHFANSVTMKTSASAGYTRLQFYEYFAGSVPGFGRNFAYNSDASVDQIKLRARLALYKSFELPNGSTFKFGGFGALGPDFSSASGTDMLSFTGFPDSSTSPGASRTALGYEVGASIGYKSPYGFKLSLDATYRRETAFPVFLRDGTNPTVLGLRGADSCGFNARFSMPLFPKIYSDARLKRDVVRLARLRNGLGLYRYRYLWSDTVYVGVMAQEVALIRPDAIVRDVSGLLRVDYGKLGLRMLTWAQWRAAQANWKTAAVH